MGGQRRNAMAALLASLTAVPLLAAGPVQAELPGGDAGTTTVIVQKAEPGDSRPERIVETLGGRVTDDLPIVDGFAAEVPTRALAALAQSPGVRTVSRDASVRVQGSIEGDIGSSVHSRVVGA